MKYIFYWITDASEIFFCPKCQSCLHYRGGSAPLSCSDYSILLLLSPALTAPYDCSSLLLWRHHMIAPVFAGQVSAPPGAVLRKVIEVTQPGHDTSEWDKWTRAITSTTSSFYGLWKVPCYTWVSYCERIFIIYHNFTMLCDRKYTISDNAKCSGFSRFRNISLAIYLVSLYCRYKEVLTRSFHYGSFGFIT